MMRGDAGLSQTWTLASADVAQRGGGGGSKHPNQPSRPSKHLEARGRRPLLDLGLVLPRFVELFDARALLE